MAQGKNQLLRGLRAHLEYHKLLGIPNYPRTEELLSFLKKQPINLSPLPQIDKLEPRYKPEPEAPPPEIDEPTVPPGAIAEEVKNCKACALHLERIYPVPGQGRDKVRLMIVGDWLAADSKGELPPDHVFGVQQDAMLGKMLEAINLPRQEVFITNVIKCGVKYNSQPQAVHVQTCVSFLRRQIASIKPDLICTMGMVAVRAILEKSQPLSRLRSHFHDYSPQKSLIIPVLATYHPTYLLQNPEMKRATWADLQMLAKKLGLQIRV